MTRIDTLHRGPLHDGNFNLGIDSIYQYRDLLSIDHIPHATPSLHTMFEAIDKFVIQKLPFTEIMKIASLGGEVEVHGIYPMHFDLLYRNEMASGDIEEIQFYHKPTTRKYNVVRPRFFINRRLQKFMACVAPGSDYVRHYGTMIRHLIELNGLHAKVKCYYYPMAFHALPFWTHLYKGFVHKGDHVFIGYVDEVFSEVNKCIELTPVSSASNPYLESRRLSLPSGTVINFLGVNFSFWGNLSQVIAESICRSGAEEIIYAGKLGSMTNPESLYKDLFVPTKYFTLNHTDVVSTVATLRNRMVEMYPHLNSGVHVSVPTIIEEDYLQRAVSHELNASSIDNEISQIAHAMANFNISNGRQVSFSAFHFATDYVRTKDECTLHTHHDLSKNRSDAALRDKDAALKRCSKYLIEYLRNI